MSRKPDAEDRALSLELRRACRAGDPEAVLPLLTSKGIIKQAFNCLCRAGHTDLAKTVDSMITDDHRRQHRARGISSACQHGHREIALWILQTDIVHARRGLFAACSGGHAELAGELVSFGEITAATQYLGDSVLSHAAFAAARANHRELALDMVSRGGELRFVLYGACSRGILPLATEMLERSCALDATAIRWAFKSSRRPMVLMLIQRGATCDLPPRFIDALGMSRRFCVLPLAVLVSPGSAADVVTELLRHGEGPPALEASEYATDVDAVLGCLTHPDAELAPRRRLLFPEQRQRLRDADVRHEIALRLIRRGANPDRCGIALDPDDLEWLIKVGVGAFGKFEPAAVEVRKNLAAWRSGLLDLTPLAEVLVDLVMAY